VGYSYNTPECAQTFQARINPFVMVDWANNWQDEYEEEGNGPFNISEVDHYSWLLRTEAGIRFYQSFLFDNPDFGDFQCRA